MPGTTGFPGGSMVRNPPANAENSGDKGLILGLGSSPWRRKCQPTPVFLPGKSHGRGAWRATVRGIPRVGCNLVTKPSTIYGKESACQQETQETQVQSLGWD